MIRLVLTVLFILSFHVKAVWIAADDSCISVTIADTNGTAILDSKAKLSISATVAGVPNTAFCPGVVYNLLLAFPEERVFILSATQGSIAAAASTACPNRLISTTGVRSMETQLTLPCTATGRVTLTLSSTPADTSAPNAGVPHAMKQDVLVAAKEACFATTKCSEGPAGSAAKPQLQLLTFPMPRFTISGNLMNSKNASSSKGFNIPSLLNLSHVRPSAKTLGLQYKLPNFTFPDMAPLLTVQPPQAEVYKFGSSQQKALPKVKVDLSAFKLPAVDQVKLNMSEADVRTVRSLPPLAEAMLASLMNQIQAKALTMGVVLMNVSEAESSATASTAAGGSKAGRRLYASSTAESNARKDNILTIMSRTGGLLSDGFSVLRASMTSISQATVLFGGMLPGIMKGTVDVDAAHLLTFCANVSNVAAELAHLVGRVLSATSDALTPLGLARDPVTGQIII